MSLKENFKGGKLVEVIDVNFLNYSTKINFAYMK